MTSGEGFPSFFFRFRISFLNLQFQQFMFASAERRAQLVLYAFLFFARDSCVPVYLRREKSRIFSECGLDLFLRPSGGCGGFFGGGGPLLLRRAEFAHAYAAAFLNVPRFSHYFSLNRHTAAFKGKRPFAREVEIVIAVEERVAQLEFAVSQQYEGFVCRIRRARG